MPPVVGISTSFVDDEQRLHVSYVHALEQSGAVPVIVPMCKERHTIVAFVDHIDALLFSGGPAVMEGLNGTLPSDLPGPDSQRLLTDRWLLEAALNRKLPLLGICYGMQLLNAYFGGSIFADADQQCGLSKTHSEKRGGTGHPLLIEKNSHLASIFGSESLDVTSRHIQAIECVAQPFTASAKAPDGIVEAIESLDGRMIGVQFHPEAMSEKMKPLFDYLVRLASRP